MLRTRSPLLFKCIATFEKPFDLHVLTTPPAFILSQDQTLRKESSEPSDSWTTWMPTEASIHIWNNIFDWGSQSIAQSKFQRAFPCLEERVRRDHFDVWPSITFSKNFLKEYQAVWRKIFKELPPFRFALLRRSSMGVRTMEIASAPSSVFFKNVPYFS